jgi:hypothetical protein
VIDDVNRNLSAQTRPTSVIPCDVNDNWLASIVFSSVGHTDDFASFGLCEEFKIDLCILLSFKNSPCTCCLR